MMARVLASLFFSGLLRDAVKVVAGLVLAVAMAQAFALASLAALLGVGASGSGVGRSSAAVIPPEQQTVFEAAASGCGLPWQVLAAITMAGGTSTGTAEPDALVRVAGDLCDQGGRQDPRHAVREVVRQYGMGEGAVEQVLTTAARHGYLAPGSRDAQVLDLARAQTGIPYLWGGASPTPGFDCSGLVQWVYRQVGVDLPRTAQQQFDATLRLTLDELRPGDLTFYARTYPSLEPITHVGIYIGNGRMIAAPREGDVVGEAPAFSGYWGEHYAGAGRIPGRR